MTIPRYDVRHYSLYLWRVAYNFLLQYVQFTDLGLAPISWAPASILACQLVRPFPRSLSGP